MIRTRSAPRAGSAVLQPIQGKDHRFDLVRVGVHGSTPKSLEVVLEVIAGATVSVGGKRKVNYRT